MEERIRVRIRFLCFSLFILYLWGTNLCFWKKQIKIIILDYSKFKGDWAIQLLRFLFVCVSCSDEELEDYMALLYLPIAPEVEDPEENPFGPPPDTSVQAAAPEDALAGSDKKQRQPSSEGGPAKKKARTTTIELQGVPSDGEKVDQNNK